MVARAPQDGIGAGEDEMDQALAGCAHEDDAPVRFFDLGLDARHLRVVAFADHDEGRVGGDEQARNRRQQRVDALLVDETTNESDDRHGLANGEAQRLPEGAAATLAGRDVERVVTRRDGRVGGGVPRRVVDAIDDADELRAAGAQDAVESVATFRRLDLARVRHADGRHRVGRHDALLQDVDLAVELGALDGERALGEAGIGEDRLGEDALVRHVVDAWRTVFGSGLSVAGRALR